jgi:isopenicillin-N epimerase
MGRVQPPEPLSPNLRQAWALRHDVAFLNHGSFGAVPRCVLEEQAEWRRRIEAEPVEVLARRHDALVGNSKRTVGDWLNMRPDDFGLVTNATEGVNAVLRSLEFRPGDGLAATSHVYNAVRQSMRYAAGRAGAAYHEIDVPLPVRSAGKVAGAVLRGLTPRTRLLVIDHVTSPTGLVFPLEAILRGCAARGVEVLVDGAHAPGMLPLDVQVLGEIGATYYAGNLHKWACAPKGAGFLWVTPRRQADVRPLIISHNLGRGFAREFDWQGTRDVTAWLAVPKALEFMARLGWERVRNHNNAMAVWAHDMLCRRLGVEPISPLDGSFLGSMAALPMPARFSAMTEDHGRALQQRLYDEHRVEAPLVLWCGRWLVRVSCQGYNTPQEYERLADALAVLPSVPSRGTPGEGGRGRSASEVARLNPLPALPRSTGAGSKPSLSPKTSPSGRMPPHPSLEEDPPC